MKIIEITDRNQQVLEHLVLVWEDSVRATHLFLSDSEITNIKGYVPEALANVPVLLAAEEAGQLVGFMGIADSMLEMLFIANAQRGQGIGRQLLQYGFDKYAISQVTVNAQNPLARQFYEHMGFVVYKRTELDEQGNPYPLLYMQKQNL